MVVFGVVALVAVGCKETTGGGWIPVHYDWSKGFPPTYSDDLLGKATFDFQMRCETVDGRAAFTAEVQYNDQYNNVEFHATGHTDYSRSCEDLDDMAELFDAMNRFKLSGTYRPQPRGKEGRFTLYVVDDGEPGIADPVDYFHIRLYGGQYGYYMNEGRLNGGNMQIHVE
jgi:hypothetical protein